MAFSPVIRRTGGLHQSAARETSEEAADVARVQCEVAHDFRCGWLLAVGDLEQKTHLGERELAVEVPLIERADDAGVEPVESSDGGDGGLRHATDVG